MGRRLVLRCAVDPECFSAMSLSSVLCSVAIGVWRNCSPFSNWLLGVQSPQYHTFVDAFAKLRKATISGVMTVCPAVSTEQLGSNWMDFHDVLYFSIR